MGDPERLLSGISDSDDLERELLASIQRIDPPAGAQAEGWARLSAQIAAVGLVGTVHGSAAAASAAQGAAAAGGVAKAGLLPATLQLLTGKVAIALAVGAVAVGASAVWVHASRASHPALAVPAPAAQPAQPVSTQLSAALPAVAAPDPALQLVPDSDLGKPSPSADQRRRDMLSAESALLTQARAQLRNGDANGAQQLLNTLHTKFPKGMLRQEREVLAIEVLSARGNKEAARRRARAFIAAYPESPHSAQLSRYADAP